MPEQQGPNLSTLLDPDRLVTLPTAEQTRESLEKMVTSLPTASAQLNEVINCLCLAQSNRDDALDGYPDKFSESLETIIKAMCVASKQLVQLRVNIYKVSGLS